MLYYCSLILPPSRFVNRERVDVMNEFHAFRYMQDKYSSAINLCPDALILVERDYKSTYFNWIGVDITEHY